MHLLILLSLVIYFWIYKICQLSLSTKCETNVAKSANILAQVRSANSNPRINLFQAEQRTNVYDLSISRTNSAARRSVAGAPHGACASRGGRFQWAVFWRTHAGQWSERTHSERDRAASRRVRLSIGRASELREFAARWEARSCPGTRVRLELSIIGPARAELRNTSAAIAAVCFTSLRLSLLFARSLWRADNSHARTPTWPARAPDRRKVPPKGDGLASVQQARRRAKTV